VLGSFAGEKLFIEEVPPERSTHGGSRSGNLRNMTDPVTLVVLVAAGGAANPATVAMARAAREALSAVSVDVRETSGEPSDDDALATERRSHAAAVVELTWNDTDRLRATLRVHFAATGRWVQRSMGFTPSDPAAERGRSLGFAVAATLPENFPSPTEAGDAGPDTPNTERPSAVPPIPEPVEPSLPQRLVPGADSSDSTPGESTRPTAQPNRPSIEVDVVAVGAIGIAGSGAGAGGGVAVRWFVAPSLSVRLGASETTGSLDAAAASMFMVATVAGVAFHPLRATPRRRLGLSLRADYLLLFQSVTHFDFDDPKPVTRDRFLSGIDAFADTSWLLSTDVALLAGVGLEDVFSPTYIDVRDARVATLPALRGAAEVGFCIRF
jgi:hypothetical protein